MVSYLTILFLGKMSRDSLPVYSAHSFTSDWQLALLESAKKNFKKKCAGHEG